MVVGCKNGSNEKVDAGQRKYCTSSDAGADRGVGDGFQAGDAADAGAGMDLAVEGPGPVDVPVPRVDGRTANMGDALGDGGDSGPTDLATGMGGSDGGGGTAGTGGTTAAGGAVGTGGSSTAGTSGAVGPDASPDLRPDAGSTTAPTDLGSGDTGSAADIGDVRGDSGAPDARADLALPAPDASADAPSPDSPANHPDGPQAVCNLSASNWAQAWDSHVTLAGLATSGDGTLWATGVLYEPFDFGTGPILYTDPPPDPNSLVAGIADVFLVKLDPTTGLATAAFDFGDSSHSDQEAVAVAVSQKGNVNVTGFFTGEIDFDPNAVNTLFGGSATLSYYATFAGTSTGSTPILIAAHAVDLGNGTLVANGSNPGVDAFVICGNADKAVPLWNSTSRTSSPAGLLKPTAATYVDGLDIVVAMIDASDGTVIWGKQLGGTGDQTCESATIDNNGDVIIAGNYGGTLDFGGGPLPSVPSGAANIYVAKLGGADGHYIAAGGWGSGGRSDASGVTVDPSNNIVLAGTIGGGVNFGGGVSIGNAGLTDAFVAKFSSPTSTSALTPLWAKSFGDNVKDQSANTVACDSLGNIYIAGTYEGSLGSFLGLSLPLSSGRNAWSAELVPDGSTLQCAQSYGVPAGTDGVTSIAVARAATGALSDAVFMGGSFSSKITFGSKVLDTGKGSTFAPFVTRFAPP